MRRWLAVVLVAAAVVLGLRLRLPPRPEAAAARPETPGTLSHAPGRWSTVAGEAVAAGPAIEGRVIDRDTRAPVAGAVVQLVGIAETVSDGDGSFVLVVPPGSRGRLTARQGRRFGRGPLVVADDPPAPAEIELASAGAISGRILDADGAPLAGAEVHVHTAGSLLHRDADEALVDQRARSDGNGRYVLEGVPAGTYGLDARAPGCGAARTVVLVETGEVIEDFILSRAARLSGRVLGPDGQPLHAPATVALGMYEHTVTDEHGGFDFPELAPGTYSALAFDPGVGAGRVAVELAAGDAQTITIELETGGVVEGTVRHADGTPVAGARVSSQILCTHTGADGRYRLAGLKTGTVELEAGMGADVGATARLFLTGNEQKTHVDLTLAEGKNVIAGLLLDGPGRPMPNETVTLTIAGVLERRLRCDAAGRFHAEGLPDGALSLAVFDGHEPISMDVEGDPLAVIFQLPRRTVIRGQVICRGAVPSFRVELTSADGSGQLRDVNAVDGRFELDDVPAGRWTLTVDADDGSTGSAELTVGDTPADVTVRLDPPGQVRGRVVDRDGRPRANVGIDDGVHTTQTAADGTFQMTVKPGDVDLSFTSDDDRVVGDSRVVVVTAGAQVNVGTVMLIDRRRGGDEDEQGFDGMEPINRDGQATVASVDPDSSAGKAGIVAGDLLFAVGGTDVSGLGGAAIDELLRGAPGATVEVTFAHPDGPPQTVALVLTADSQPND